LNIRFSNKYAFHVHVTAQVSSGNVIVISLFIRLLARKLCCHFLVQCGYTTDPRAACGPPQRFQWPAEPFRKN